MIYLLLDKILFHQVFIEESISSFIINEQNGFSWALGYISIRKIFSEHFLTTANIRGGDFYNSELQKLNDEDLKWGFLSGAHNLKFFQLKLEIKEQIKL
jgi:hypothetical protein